MQFIEKEKNKSLGGSDKKSKEALSRSPLPPPGAPVVAPVVALVLVGAAPLATGDAPSAEAAAASLGAAAVLAEGSPVLLRFDHLGDGGEKGWHERPAARGRPVTCSSLLDVLAPSLTTLSKSESRRALPSSRFLLLAGSATSLRSRRFSLSVRRPSTSSRRAPETSRSD